MLALCVCESAVVCLCAVVRGGAVLRDSDMWMRLLVLLLSLLVMVLV